MEQIIGKGCSGAFLLAISDWPYRGLVILTVLWGTEKHPPVTGQNGGLNRRRRVLKREVHRRAKEIVQAHRRVPGRLSEQLRVDHRDWSEFA
jgi:hypothetical protein